jgi:hypothetical protein
MARAVEATSALPGLRAIGSQLSSCGGVDDLDATRCRKLHVQLLAGNFFDAAGHRPRRLFDLKLSVFDFVRAALRLLSLEIHEELAGLMTGSHQRQRACDQRGEQQEIDPDHHRNGASVRSATRSIALRDRVFASCSTELARIARPTSLSGGCGSAALGIGIRASR